jgi:hypothetical protein
VVEAGALKKHVSNVPEREVMSARIAKAMEMSGKNVPDATVMV